MWYTNETKKPTPDTDNWNTENAFNENSLVSLPRQEIGERLRSGLIKLAALYYTRMQFYVKLLLKTKSQYFRQFYEDLHLPQPYFCLAFFSRKSEFWLGVSVFPLCYAMPLGTVRPVLYDRRFATLQSTPFIYLINKYISLSDICLTLHHRYK